MARARCLLSVSRRSMVASGLAYARAGTAPQAIDGHDRPGAPVGHRVEVERPVEVERDRAVAALVGRELGDLVRAALQLVVVGNRARYRPGLHRRAPALRRAADDVAVALLLVEVDQPGLQLALVVLDVHDPAGAEHDAPVVGHVRPARRELRPAIAV